MGVVRDHVQVRIALVDGGLESGDLLLGELGPFESTDQFLRLAGEHRAADDLDAARFFCVFQKHFLNFARLTFAKIVIYGE